jgi:hypothetical protein
MEHDSSLRPKETAATGAAPRLVRWARESISSRDLALKVCVASVAAVLLGRLGPIAAVGGVVGSLVVESAVERAVRRLRRRTLWGISLLALLLDRADKVLAAVGLGGRRRAGAATPGATAAAIVVAGSIVVVGFTIPEAALGHALAGSRHLTFFGARRATVALPVLRLPTDVKQTATGPTPISYHADAVQAGGDAVPVHCRPTSGSTFPLGRTVVTCTAGGTSGSFAVTIDKLDRPVFPRHVEAEAAGPGGARVLYSVRSPRGVLVGCRPASGTVFALGRTRVVCTAAAGRPVVRGSFVVTVADSRPPLISVPQTVNASTGSASTVLRFSAAARDVVDGTVPVSCSPPSGSRFLVGTAPVTCTAADAHGNRARRTFTVVVVHTKRVLPTLLLPAPRAAEATSTGGARVDFVVTAREGAASLTPSCHPASGSQFALGTTTVACSATDAEGRRSDGSFTVTVQDTKPPDMHVPADVVREATSHAGAVVEFSASATDVASGRVVPECSPRSGTTFPIATTPVSCTAKDSRRLVARRSFAVRIVDAPPTLRLPATVTAAALGPSGARVKYPPPTAVDRVDGKDPVSCLPAPGALFPVGGNDVTCTARDSGGNVVRGTFRVAVEDTTKPILTVPERPLSAPAGEPFPYATAVQASDNVDGPVTPSCRPPSGTPFPVGSTTVECTATDAAGNTVQASFTVVAVDRTPPVLRVPSAPVAVPVGARLSYSKLVVAVDAIDGAVRVNCKPPSGSVVLLGPHAVYCAASDAAGNVARATFTVVGRDLTPPVLTVPASPLSWPAGVALSYAGRVSASDAVDGPVTPSCSPPSGSSFSPGRQRVTCTATDRAGNTATATFDVDAYVIG